MNIKKKETILIFGGGGYIGCHLSLKLRSEQTEIFRLSTRELKPIDHVRDILIDFDHLEIQRDLFESADIIYFLRSQTSAYKAEENPLEDFKANLNPLVSVLAQIHKTKKLPKFVFTSTVTVYGLTPTDLAIDETYNTSPLTIYEVHKLLAENAIINYSKRNIIDGVIFRLANVYGPGINSSSNDRGILNQLAKRAVNSEPITLYGDGNYLRDYVYIDDVTNALVQVKSSKKLNGEIYNLSSGVSITLKTAVEKIQHIVMKLLNKEIKFNFIPEPEQMLIIEKRNYLGNIKKIKSNLNWIPMTSIDQGLENTVISFLNK